MAIDTGELTFGDNNLVTEFELDVGGGDGYDVGIVDGGQLDEVGHHLIRNGERGIAVGGITAICGVVVVDAYE